MNNDANTNEIDEMGEGLEEGEGEHFELDAEELDECDHNGDDEDDDDDGEDDDGEDDGPALPAYGDAGYRRFVRDCRRAGFRVMHYRGRNFWKGSAVVTDDVHDVVRATQVKVQWDNMGLGYVVYPRH